MKNKEEKKTVVPKLRFPEFKDAGKWEEKKLSDILTYERPDDYIVSSTNNDHKGVPVLTANKSFVLGYTQETYGIYKNTPVIIFDDFTVDKKYVDFPFKVKSSAIKILKTKDKDNTRFIYDLITQITFEAKEHKRYYISAYQNLWVFIPHPDEQQKIADFLSSIDELINAQNQKLKTLKGHKKGLMQQLFPVKGETVPKLRFPEFRDTEEWEQKPLFKFGKILGGLTGKTSDDFGKGKPYVTYKQVFNASVIDIMKCEFVNIKDNEKQNVLQYGDILFTMSSETPDEVGIASVLLEQSEKPIYLNSFCSVFRPDNLDVLSPYFSRYLFNSPIYRSTIQVIAQGIIRFNISKSAFLNLALPITHNKTEQQKIANCLSSIDELISAQSQKLEILKAHKKGLMQQLFPNVNDIIK